MRKLTVGTAMSRPTKNSQPKRVTPPAVPEIHRHSGSSFGSAGYSSLEDGGFSQPRDSPAALSMKDDSTEYAFTFPTFPPGEPLLTHKAAVYYHQQLALQEDQGIDLTQSPGRDSPGSSSGSAGSGSRHSTASLDSGRASSYITGGGASTRGPLSSPRCSVSSCSIGSVDRISQRGENDIVMDWLMDIKFENYATLFIDAGYDLATISRMTPEDLTAIGIKNPQHRERIKQHIDNLRLPDRLPHFVPGSIEEWLRLLRLEEYIQPLLDQNYKTVRDVTQVIWEDLEDIGIVKLGHQKKILLAIKRVKDIISGKWNPHQQMRQLRGKSLESLEDISERNVRGNLTFSHYSTDSYYYGPPQQPPQAMSKSICLNATSLPYNPIGNLQWRRSYDDGDITPTNEIAIDMGDGQGGGGTLPRQRSSSRSRLADRASPSTIIIHTPHSGEYLQPDNSPIMLANPHYGSTFSPLASKKQAPEPPRRQCSIRNMKSNNLQEAQPCNYKYLHYDQLANNQARNQHPTQYIPAAGTSSTVAAAPHQQPIYVNYNVQTHQTTAEIHCDRTHDSKSNSSIDSIDTIPFANENTGTIKQRLLNRQEISSSLSLSSSSSSSSTNTVANMSQSFHSFKKCDKHSPPSPATLSPTILASNTPNGGGGGTPGKIPAPLNMEVRYHHSELVDDQAATIILPNAVAPAQATPAGAGGSVPNATNDSANVLNDIGNMLANLTDELDAMLEEEKRAGINDSE